MTASSSSFDAREFRTALGQFCTGITIITTMRDAVPVGFACQSFAAVSLDPPLVLFCPTKGSRSWAAIESTGRFAVNVLSEEQRATCARFGSREPDKFAGIVWRPSPLGSPILDGSLVHLDCTVEAVYDGGDHAIVIGRVRSLGEIRQARPLLFLSGQYTGIEPEKNTPAPWRDDLDAFLTNTSSDTWL